MKDSEEYINLYAMPLIQQAMAQEVKDRPKLKQVNLDDVFGTLADLRKLSEGKAVDDLGETAAGAYHFLQWHIDMVLRLHHMLQHCEGDYFKMRRLALDALKLVPDHMNQKQILRRKVLEMPAPPKE
ncbi:MAG: hypothetical protein U0X20_07950 [Caldilineaceae bacterium]